VEGCREIHSQTRASTWWTARRAMTIVLKRLRRSRSTRRRRARPSNFTAGFRHTSPRRGGRRMASLVAFGWAAYGSRTSPAGWASFFSRSSEHHGASIARSKRTSAVLLHGRPPRTSPPNWPRTARWPSPRPRTEITAERLPRTEITAERLRAWRVSSAWRRASSSRKAPRAPASTRSEGRARAAMSWLFHTRTPSPAPPRRRTSAASSSPIHRGPDTKIRPGGSLTATRQFCGRSRMTSRADASRSPMLS
jgi:hypothetical protein